jgi:hypothetical protein
MKSIICNTLIGVALALTPLFNSTGYAAADSLTVDTDLRAVYCLSLLKEVRAFQQNIQIPINAPESLKQTVQQALQKELQENQELQSRLKRYIVLRLDYIDTLQFALASKAGKSDFAKVTDPNNPKLIECEKRCDPPQPETAQSGQCLKQCGQEDTTIRRVQSCQDLAFLPY